MKKEQSAIESLSIYGLAFVVIATVLFIAYFLFNTQQITSTENACAFSQSAYLDCKSISVTSNSAGTSAVLLISNGQQYALKDANIIMNTTSTGPITGTCTPSTVLPGGYMECVINTQQRITSGQAQHGQISMQYDVCYGSSELCNSPELQFYQGSFTAYVANSISVPECTMVLTAENKTENGNGSGDLLTANVKFNGYSIAGATVNFTSSSSNVTISPRFSNTDQDGNATAYASSHVTARTVVVASFATCTGSNTIYFIGPQNYTLTLVSSPAGAGNLTGSGTYVSGTLQSFSERAGRFYSFLGWNGVGTGNYTGTRSSTSVRIESDITETATYNSLRTTCSNTQSITGSSGTYNVLLSSNTLNAEGSADSIRADATNDLCYNTELSLTGSSDSVNVINGTGITMNLDGSEDVINMINSSMGGRQLTGSSDDIYNAIFTGNYMSFAGSSDIMSFYIENRTGTEFYMTGSSNRLSANILSTGVFTLDVQGSSNNFYLYGGSANILIPTGSSDNVYICRTDVIYNSLGISDHIYTMTC